jgi:multiple sugar transport system substrate-binding protein
MSTMRPFQIIILAIFALVALLALALFASFNGFGKTEDEVGKVVIWGTIPARQMEPVINQLIQLHKEYGQVTYVEKNDTTLDTDIANAIAAGSGPDLVLMNQEHLMEERARLQVIPSSSISERTYRDTFLPIFDLYLTSEGTYGIPLLVDPLVLYYNKQALTSAGIAQPPTTWEAVSGLTPSLTRITDAQTITRSTISMGGYENITNAPATIATLFFQAGQSISTNTNQGVRAALSGGGDSSFGVTSSESALNFYTEFSNPTKTTYTWSRALPTSRLMFATGDLVFYPGFASERSVIAQTNPNLSFDMAAMPQPQTASTRVTYGRAYALVIPKASRNANGAYDVATALTQKDMLPTLARSVGMAPAVRAQLVPSNQDLFEPVFYPQALIAKGWLSPAPATLDTIFAAMIGNVTSGRLKPKDALNVADQALNAAL